MSEILISFLALSCRNFMQQVVLLVVSLVVLPVASLVLPVLVLPAVSLVPLVVRKVPVSRRLINGCLIRFLLSALPHHFLHVYLDFLLQNLYYSAF